MLYRDEYEIHAEYTWKGFRTGVLLTSAAFAIGVLVWWLA